MTVEIPGSPVSRHDLDVILQQLTRVRLQALEPSEIVVSSRRIIVAHGCKEPFGLRVAGIPVRASDEYALNEGAIIVDGHAPELFDFEADS